MTIVFPGGPAPAAGRTPVEITYQSFPAELRSATYSEVVATYPANAQRCSTWITVTAVSPSGQWSTAGIVEHRKGQPQLQCLGTKVTLAVPAVAGGVQYDAGTLLTVDKNGRWVAVKSWD